MTTGVQDLTPGTIIQDTYEITRLMGEGGMGATFAGRNLATDHDVAIKVISAAFSGNNRAVELFKREANLLRTIQHEAIVRYETTLQDKDGRLFLVMELLAGEPLSHYITNGARLGSEDVLKLGRRLAAGLDAIAAVGTVHRDIAPDNIFVPDDDILSAKLIDFGLASNTVGTDKSILGTDFAGKFSYCAPEQFGYFDGKISPATDAYALGLVLMKVAGLEVPGFGLGLGAGPARQHDLDIPNNAISAQLHSVLLALLRADPEQRPSPLTPVFEKALSSIGHATPRSEKTEAAIIGAEKQKTPARNWLLPVLGGGALVAAAVIGYFQFATPGGGSDLEGASISEGEEAERALAAADPFVEITALIDAGDSRSLNAALGAYIAFGNEEANSTEDRIAAFLKAAAMADPEGFDGARSPFDEPNPSVARSAYRSAADLGSAEAARALTRLEN